MTKEYTYQDLFEGEKFGLNSALRDSVDYIAFAKLSTMLLLSHNQINKLEARIAELEKQIAPSVTIGPSMNEYAGIMQEAFRQGVIKEEDWSLLRTKVLPNTFTIEHNNLPVFTGYVPDDLRQP